MRFYMTPQDVDRFWSKVLKKEGQCWLWTAGKDKDGYGQFWLTSQKRSVRSHQISYFLAHQCDIINFILHSCDNPACVNPSHLREGTHLDNQRDRVIRKRSAKGSKHSQHKLTEVDVAIIRHRRESGHKVVDIARDFNVSCPTISTITRRLTWRHV